MSLITIEKATITDAEKLTEIKNYNTGSVGFNKLYDIDTYSKLGGYPAYKITHEKWFKSLKAASSQKTDLCKIF